MFIAIFRADPVLITPLTFQSNILDNVSDPLQPEQISIDDSTFDYVERRQDTVVVFLFRFVI